MLMKYLQRDGAGIQHVFDNEPAVDDVIVAYLHNAAAQICTLDVRRDTFNLCRRSNIYFPQHKMYSLEEDTAAKDN